MFIVQVLIDIKVMDEYVYILKHFLGLVDYLLDEWSFVTLLSAF